MYLKWIVFLSFHEQYVQTKWKKWKHTSNTNDWIRYEVWVWHLNNQSSSIQISSGEMRVTVSHRSYIIFTDSFISRRKKNCWVLKILCHWIFCIFIFPGDIHWIKCIVVLKIVSHKEVISMEWNNESHLLVRLNILMKYWLNFLWIFHGTTINVDPPDTNNIGKTHIRILWYQLKLFGKNCQFVRGINIINRTDVLCGSQHKRNKMLLHLKFLLFIVFLSFYIRYIWILNILAHTFLIQ